MQRGIVALVFLCNAPAMTPTTSGEAADTAWLTPDQVAQQMDEAYAVRLLDALGTSVPSIRAHDGIRLLANPGPEAQRNSAHSH